MIDADDDYEDYDGVWAEDYDDDLTAEDDDYEDDDYEDYYDYENDIKDQYEDITDSEHTPDGAAHFTDSDGKPSKPPNVKITIHIEFES